MKKRYFIPELSVIFITDNEIISTSGTKYGGKPDGYDGEDYKDL